MHYTPFAPLIASSAVLIPLVFTAIVWTITLKGVSLWYAARGGQKWWFIAMLVINTVGILEIIYLIWFRPKDTKSTMAPAQESSSDSGQEQK